MLSFLLLASVAWIISIVPPVDAVAVQERSLTAMDLIHAEGSLGASYTCTKTQSCASGCCRIDPNGNGNCGLGPTFCGAGNCTSTCDQKSQCDPGWGPSWSSAEKCPLNVCCSKYGFCGTGELFCGNAQISRPSCKGSSTTKRSIGYYEGWSVEHPCQTMTPDQIHLGTFSHLNMAFEYIDPSTYYIADMDQNVADQYHAFSQLKSKQPDIELWMSIGGWSFNDPGPTASTFSNLVASPSAQNAFFASVLSFLTKYNLDGVDIDWEYPVASDRHGSSQDYQNYVSFLQNFRHALDTSGVNKRYGLSITIPSSYWYLQNFDIIRIDPIIDWFNMMTYDLHGTWDGPQDQIGSIVLAHTNLTEIKQSFDLLWRNHIDPGKVNMGLGFYGRSFTLANPSCKSAGCPFSKGGNPGPCTGTSGILSYAEIENVIHNDSATITLDSDAAVQIVTWDNNQWVSFDDSETFQMKVDYANSLCIGGTLVWAVDLDASGNGTDSLHRGARIPTKTTYNETSMETGIVPDFPSTVPAGALPTILTWSGAPNPTG